MGGKIVTLLVSGGIAEAILDVTEEELQGIS